VLSHIAQRLYFHFCLQFCFGKKGKKNLTDKNKPRIIVDEYYCINTKNIINLCLKLIDTDKQSSLQFSIFHFYIEINDHNVV
jgi:hypothetical protein